MKAPVLGKKYVIPAVITTAVLSAACIFINAWMLPGWSFSGTAELLVIALACTLFSDNWSPATVRFGIMVYAVTTGLLAVAKNHPALLGDFSFGIALGPYANSVGALIALPWYITIILSYAIATSLTENIYLRSLLGAVFGIVPAIFMMYNSEALDFYYWTALVPPIKAFVVWFMAIFILHFAGNQLEIRSANPIAKPLYIIWFGFHFLLFFIRLI